MAQIVDRCFDYAMDARLARQKDVIERAAAVLKHLSTLSSALDKLLATAVLFI